MLRYNGDMTSGKVDSAGSDWLGRVLLLGAGVTGAAVARFLVTAAPPLCSQLTIYTGKDNTENSPAARELQAICQAAAPAFPVQIICGSDTVAAPDQGGSGQAGASPAGARDRSSVAPGQGKFDLAVVSPGLPPGHALVVSARAAAQELIGEPELAWRLSPERWAVVTGTNGKTTTTALISHCLNACGIPARAVGNIGSPCIEGVSRRGPGEWLVAELSSYQLYSMPTFAPEAAVLLNVTPDHLSWHGSHQDYLQSKLQLFANLGAEAVAVADSSVIGLLPPGDYARLCIEQVQLPALPRPLQIKGPHNLANAQAATAVLRSLPLSIGEAALASALAGFKPLEHRFEPVAIVNGVCYINDSKATNTDAAIKALETFEGDEAGRVLALLGGRDKNTGLDELVDVALAVCKAVVCYGEARERFLAAFNAAKPGPRVFSAANMAEAFSTAAGQAAGGDVVLLSPACASFDEFDSYEARGEAFKQLVADLDARAGG